MKVLEAFRDKSNYNIDKSIQETLKYMKKAIRDFCGSEYGRDDKESEPIVNKAINIINTTLNPLRSNPGINPKIEFKLDDEIPKVRVAQHFESSKEAKKMFAKYREEVLKIAHILSNHTEGSIRGDQFDYLISLGSAIADECLCVNSGNVGEMLVISFEMG